MHKDDTNEDCTEVWTIPEAESKPGPRRDGERVDRGVQLQYRCGHPFPTFHLCIMVRILASQLTGNVHIKYSLPSSFQWEQVQVTGGCGVGVEGNQSRCGTEKEA